MLSDSRRLLRCNPLMRFHLGRPITAELLLEQETVTIDSPHVFTALALARQPVAAHELASALSEALSCTYEEAEAEVQTLTSVGLLKDAVTQDPRVDAAAHWERRGWLEALILHLRTRDLRHNDEYQDDSLVGIPVGASTTPDASFLRCAPGDVPGRILLPIDAGSLALPADQSLETVLLRRRSGGRPRGRGATLNELSAILAAANTMGRINRAAMRANGDQAARLLHSSFSSLESMVVCADVADVPAGLYAYDVPSHSLSLVEAGDHRAALARVCIGQKWPTKCAFSIMIMADWESYQRTYPHARAYRNLMINVGELAQQYLIAGTAFDLANFITPAFRDDLAAELFRADLYRRAPIYSVSFG